MQLGKAGGKSRDGACAGEMIGLRHATKTKWREIQICRIVAIKCIVDVISTYDDRMLFVDSINDYKIFYNNTIKLQR